MDFCFESVVFWMKFIASVSARGMCALHRDKAADSQVKGQGCSQLCRQKRHTNKPKDAQTHAHTEDHNTKITAHLLHLRASFSWPDSSCGFARNRLTPSRCVALALLTATAVLVMFTRRRIFWCSLFFFQRVFFCLFDCFVKLSFFKWDWPSAKKTKRSALKNDHVCNPCTLE